MSDPQNHIPVMLPEVLAYLQPKDGDVIVDGTFGNGGYSRAFLDKAECTVIGIDRDPNVVRASQSIMRGYKDRFTMVEGCFGSMDQHVKDQVDAVVLDIGVSSMQIDDGARGFSFKKDGPLDMRMSQTGTTAEELVNTLEFDALANILYTYGEEKQSRRVASAIIKARAQSPITRTLQLADIIRGAVIKHPRSKDKSDKATRSFQALRIYINDELGELERGLQAATKILKPGGRLVVVTFHSLEDGIVKKYLKTLALPPKGLSRYTPLAKAQEDFDPVFTLITKKPVTVSADEAQLNVRSRSAKLRCAVRTDIPFDTSTFKKGHAA